MLAQTRCDFSTAVPVLWLKDFYNVLEVPPCPPPSPVTSASTLLPGQGTLVPYPSRFMYGASTLSLSPCLLLSKSR